MTEPTARDMALESARLWKKCEDETDAIGVQTVALVAIALQLTEETASSVRVPTADNWPTAESRQPVGLARIDDEAALVDRIAAAIALSDRNIWEGPSEETRNWYRINARAALTAMRAES